MAAYVQNLSKMLRLISSSFGPFSTESCSGLSLVMKTKRLSVPFTAFQKKRVYLLCKHIKDSTTITSPEERRGKHNNRPNAIPEEITTQVDLHIKNFPRRSSHYSRKRNLKTYCLSPELNVRKMYELYLEKFDPNMKTLLDDRKEKTADFKPLVTYNFYFRYFKANFNYKFGHPRSDTCQRCDELHIEAISSTISEERRVQIEAEKMIHLDKAQSFYDDLAEKTNLAKDNSNIEVLSFDYQQNIPLPKVPSGDAFYLRQLWLFNFCIHSGKNGIAHFYVYDETEGRKTPNEPISFLLHYIENVLSDEVDTLYIFSDNCSAQNKNNTMVQFLFTLVKSGRFKNIVHRFPEPGHSFLPCDRCFGVLEKSFRKTERVYLPQEYIQIMKRCSRLFDVIRVEQMQIKNFVALFQPYFIRATINKTSRERFCITHYKIFVYDSEHPDIQCCKLHNKNDNKFITFPIQKTQTLPSVTDAIPTYTENLPLKEGKFDHVMRLANKYVPQNDIWYYQQLKSNNISDDSTDVSEVDGNE